MFMPKYILVNISVDYCAATEINQVEFKFYHEVRNTIQTYFLRPQQIDRQELCLFI